MLVDCVLSQVKIRNWIKGQEEPEVVGVSARFGKAVSDHEEQKHSVPLAKLDPEDACTDSIKPVRTISTFFCTT
jgi:signal peptide peptidase-like protein 2B